MPCGVGRGGVLVAVGGGTAVSVAIGMSVGTAAFVGAIVGSTSVAVAVGGRVLVGCGVSVLVGEVVIVGKKRVGVDTAVVGSAVTRTACAGVICAIQAVSKALAKSKMTGISKENSLLRWERMSCISGFLSIMGQRITKGKSHVKQI